MNTGKKNNVMSRLPIIFKDMAVVRVGKVHGEVVTCRKEDEGDTEGG